MSRKDNKDCIFCKIINNELPSSKVFENKNFLVFMDIRPVNHGHLLIIPKKHITWMQETPDKTLSDIFKLTKKMMVALKKGLGCDYVEECVVGTEIPHFHIHLIPRYFNDDAIIVRNLKEYKEKEIDICRKKIISAVQPPKNRKNQFKKAL